MTWRLNIIFTRQVKYVFVFWKHEDFFPFLLKGQKRSFGSSVVSDIYVLSVFWMYEGSDLLMTNPVVLIYVEWLYPVCGGSVQRSDFLLLWGEKNTLWSSLKDQECLVKKGQELLHWFWRSDSNGAICRRILLFVSLMASYFAGACFAVLSTFLCSLLESEHDTLHKPPGKRTLIRQPIKILLQKDT